MSFDLRPTDRLQGLHLEGIVERRFLLSYPVPASCLAPWMPPGCEPSLHAGCGWVSACFVEMRAMRPLPIPAALGMRFRYLVHRTRARLPFPDGRRREAVLVLEASIDRRFPAALGRACTGVRFAVRDIELAPTKRGWSLSMAERGELLFAAQVDSASLGERLPAASRFASVGEADEFLLGVAYGADWKRARGRLSIVPETHAPWATLAGSCVTLQHHLLSRLAAPCRADHVLTMTEVPHYFGLRGVDVPLSGGARRRGRAA